MPGPAKFVTVRGFTGTWNAVARHFGVTSPAFYGRMIRGWTPEQAAGLEPPPAIQHDDANTYSIGDFTGTMCAMSQRFGVHHETIRTRLVRGWTLAQAVGLSEPPVATKADDLVHWKGEWKSLEEWAPIVGLSAKILGERLVGGMHADEALSTPALIPLTNRNPAGENNNMANTLDEIAEATGVTRQAIQQAANRGMGRMQRSLIAAACIDWRGERGEVVTDDEAAEVIACVAADRDLKRMLFKSDLDVAPLCKAIVKMRVVGLSGEASREMLVA